MDPSAQAVRRLGVDRAEAYQATKSRLHMAARAAEPVVQIEMAERGIEVVAPHQDHDPASEPDAFRVSGGAVDGLRCFNEFIGLALTVLGGFGGSGRICRRLAGLVLRAKVAALGEGATGPDQECKQGNGEVAQSRNLKPENTGKHTSTHNSTHKFPDLLPARSPPGGAGCAGLMPLK
jgi:hypothetical protein